MSCSLPTAERLALREEEHKCPKSSAPPEVLEDLWQKQIRKIDKLLLSGGSSRGYSYIGLIQYLEKVGIRPQLKFLVGTSIGALVVSLLNLGYSGQEMEIAFRDYDYEKYQSVDLMSIFEKFGMDNFEKTLQFIRQLFIKKGFSPDITFQTLYERTHQHLVINAVCLNIPASVFFDYIKTPEMPVITAIQASMSLPYIFATVTYQGLTYSDGGILNNFAIDCEIFNCDPETILAVSLHNPNTRSVKEITTLDQFTVQIMTCIGKLTAGNFDRCPVNSHLIKISAPQFHTLSLSLSPDDKKFLKTIGYERTQQYFEKTLKDRLQTQWVQEQHKRRVMERRNQIRDRKTQIEAQTYQSFLDLLGEGKVEELKVTLEKKLTETNSKLSSNQKI